ncbi:MAG: Manganese transport system membrane protein MntB [Candidatus Heimdallarchaeota archaeon AB_125]|nr:MAG: Manganese transport system membrane protein MntB [Candidatus Heimdallarchaeota archaeon AB_125]
MLISLSSLAVSVASYEENDNYSFSDEPTGEIKVVTSLSIIADWAAEIGEGYFSPAAVVTGGEDPHTYELSPSAIQMISASDLFIVFGLPGLESWIDLDSTDYSGLNVLYLATEDMMKVDPVTSDKNPHIWMDPNYAKIFVQNITYEVILLDIGHQTEYETNRDNYLAEIDDLLIRIQEDPFNQTLGMRVVVHHPSFLYLLDVLGVERVGVIEEHEGSEPSLRHIREIEATMIAENISIIVTQPQLEGNQILNLARKTNASLAKLTPLLGINNVYTYIDMIEYNVLALLNPEAVDAKGWILTAFIIGMSFFSVTAIILGYFRFRGESLDKLKESPIVKTVIIITLIGGLSAITVIFSDIILLRALVTALIIGILGGVIGVFVLLKGMVFLGEAIAHSAFAGAALGILLGIDPLITIIAFGLIASLGVGYVNEKKVMKDEVIIGIVFTSFMALAILFIGLMPFYSTDVRSILFGNIFLVSMENLVILFFVAISVILIIFGLKKEYYLMTFNPAMAAVIGIPVRFLNYLFLALMAITIDISLKAVGAILVFAMIITPAAAAYQWTFKLKKMLFLGSLFGVISGFLGVTISYLWDIPSGSTIVGIATLIFVVSFIASPKRRKSGTGHVVADCEYCSRTILGKQYCIEDNCVAKDIPHKHDEKGLIIYKTDLGAKKIPSKHKHDNGGKKQ